MYLKTAKVRESPKNGGKTPNPVTLTGSQFLIVQANLEMSSKGNFLSVFRAAKNYSNNRQCSNNRLNCSNNR
jgi:hypothetical protein